MTLQLQPRQTSFPEFCPVTAAAYELAQSGSIDERGAVYTKREVVDFILDLAGYRSEKPLHQLKLLEPSFGEGDFLFPAVDRLLCAWKASADTSRPMETLAGCLRAVELHRDTYQATFAALVQRLTTAGIERVTADSIADRWLLHGDFLLAELSGDFDVVVGNPPYVRQEMIPAVLLAEYRNRYSTVFDRADLYIPFIERSLRLLRVGGVLGFICADRWMKNRYGGPLRALVAKDFHLRVHVDMTDTPAFHSEVIAYPAIIIIAREDPGPTRLAFRPEIERRALNELAANLLASRVPEGGTSVRELADVASGSEPWVMTGSEELALVRRIERDFPTIEDSGCKIGIGVATGADHAFIGMFSALDVEADRKQPLVMTRDLVDGEVKWRGFGVIDPFDSQGGLVSLDAYPRLRRYLANRRDDIANRHCAKRSPANWYRTIDRITPSLARRPKLLIPDIKGAAHIVYEDGLLYPHHNLYYIVADEWNLRALQAVLLSGMARLFVASYSTQMRGGFLRFQAQYLRRIRVPNWSEVNSEVRQELIVAAESRNLVACVPGQPASSTGCLARRVKF